MKASRCSVALSVGVLSLCLCPTAFAQPSIDPAIDDLEITLFEGGLAQPSAAEFLPDGRLVIIEKQGGIKVRPAGGGTLIDAGSISVEGGGEQGLLGLAVDPMFSTSNRLYFYFSKAGEPSANRHRVAYATLDPNTNEVDTANMVEIVDGLWGPANHNGGGIHFGPDGHLYIAVGDTGCNCSCSPGQGDNYFPTCLTNKNGKILRVDRDGNAPSGNPLVGTATVASCPDVPRPCSNASTVPDANSPAAPDTTIYNWGFRNPWRFAFDPYTGYMWIGDVGEVTYEEITISTGPGQHHGWPFREGSEGLNVDECAQSTPSSGNCKDPAFAYPHNETPASGSGSVTAGAFSSHCGWPEEYQDLFWFGDFNKARIWTLEPNANRDGVVANSRTTVVRSLPNVHFFTGTDAAIYVINIFGGSIWRIAPTNPENCVNDAGVLDMGVADTGVAPDAGPTPDTGVEPDAGGGNDTGAGNDAESTDINDIDAGSGSDAGDDDAGVGAEFNDFDAGTGNGDSDDGCGCSTASKAAASPNGSWALLGVLLLLGLRRRRN